MNNAIQSFILKMEIRVWKSFIGTFRRFLESACNTLLTALSPVVMPVWGSETVSESLSLTNTRTLQHITELEQQAFLVCGQRFF